MKTLSQIENLIETYTKLISKEVEKLKELKAELDKEIKEYPEDEADLIEEYKEYINLEQINFLSENFLKFNKMRSEYLKNAEKKNFNTPKDGILTVGNTKYVVVAKKEGGENINGMETVYLVTKMSKKGKATKALYYVAANHSNAQITEPLRTFGKTILNDAVKVENGAVVKIGNDLDFDVVITPELI